MIPYVRNIICDEEFDLYQRIEVALEQLPEIDLGNDENGHPIILSCHILARAVAAKFGLKFVDGIFHPYFEHSWVLTPKGNIIDVYPVATLGGPILVVVEDSPAEFIYLVNNVSQITRRSYEKKFESGSFRQAVEKITEFL